MRDVVAATGVPKYVSCGLLSPIRKPISVWLTQSWFGVLTIVIAASAVVLLTRQHAAGASFSTMMVLASWAVFVTCAFCSLTYLPQSGLRFAREVTTAAILVVHALPYVGPLLHGENTRFQTFEKLSLNNAGEELGALLYKIGSTFGVLALAATIFFGAASREYFRSRSAERSALQKSRREVH